MSEGLQAWAARRHFSAAELRTPAAAPLPRWALLSPGLMLVAAMVLPAGAMSALNGLLVALALACVLGAGARLDSAQRRLAGVLAPLAAMVAIGVGMGFDRIAEGQAYDFLKDGWYFANPMLALAAGFVFGHALQAAATAEPARRALAQARALRAFVLGGTAVAVLHLLWFAFNPQLLSWEATEVRGAIGTGWWASALAVLLLAAHAGRPRAGLALAPPLAMGAALLCTASVVLSFSRVLALVTLLGVAVVLGALVRHEGRRLLLLALVGVLAILALRVVIDPESREARTGFFGKFARVPEELWPSDRLHGQEVHDNWRGYETARALRHWAAGHPGQWLLGDGFGALVDLGRFQQLSPNPRERMRFIPVFHNGYIYVLVKTGLVGLGLYGWMLWRLYRLGRADARCPDPGDAGETRRRHGRLLQAMAVTLALSTGVWSGVFAKADLLAFLLLTGWLLAQAPPQPVGTEPPREPVR
jgi:hypothetical protein